MNADTRHNTWNRAIALVAVGFGAFTLKEGGAVLFSDGAARAAAGDYVPFVLWFNFTVGFVYIVAGIGLWLHLPAIMSAAKFDGNDRMNMIRPVSMAAAACSGLMAPIPSKRGSGLCC